MIYQEVNEIRILNKRLNIETFRSFYYRHIAKYIVAKYHLSINKWEINDFLKLSEILIQKRHFLISKK